MSLDDNDRRDYDDDFRGTKEPHRMAVGSK
jgi:hypothetical protein